MSTSLTHPKGQTVTVPDDVAEYYLDKGWTHSGVQPAPVQDGVEIPAGAPVEAWKVGEVDAFAAREGIDLGDAKNKTEKLSVIASALQEKEAAGGAEAGSGSAVPDAGAGS